MTAPESLPPAAAEAPVRLALELSRMALKAGNLEAFAEGVLDRLAHAVSSESLLMYVTASATGGPRFFQHGFQSASMPELEALCEEQSHLFTDQPDRKPIRMTSSASPGIHDDLILIPLRAESGNVGLVGYAVPERADPKPSCLVEALSGVLAAGVTRLDEKAKTERQLSQLNAYLTISTMLAQSMGLHEILEIALYCCMELVSASEASVLLLDDEKKNFRIYHVEGPAKPAIEGVMLPADSGLAGAVLASQQVEVVNDVHKDPRFYGRIDAQYGFLTTNMIAIPLTAGEEKVGVLEVINKQESASFTREESRLLLSISEEISFAIRNAKIFEFVVNSYCKQRQGQLSCKGCNRPLGSWTPCVKYREAAV